MFRSRFAASLGHARALLLSLLLLALATPLGAEPAPDLPLEQALRRDGVVFLAISPELTEVGLVLHAMGSEAAVDEQSAASLWRIRNLDDEPRDVVLEAVGGDAFWGLRLDAREEAWIRSPVIAGEARHRLRHRDQIVAELAASSLTFSASHLITDPSLRNRAPLFRAAPQRLLDAGHGLRFDPAAQDLDGDSLLAKPANEDSDVLGRQDPPRFEWWPNSEQVGEHLLELQLEDAGESVSQLDWQVRVVDDFCPIYPIALPQDVLHNLAPGALVERLPRKSGAGGFAWLSWTGDSDADTLAASLLGDGDSWQYGNPDDSNDTRLDSGDFARSAPGSMNSAEVRAQLDQLLGRVIVVPVWDAMRGQGSRLAYRHQKFVSIRLAAYQLTGQGWLSFDYLGDYERCYNDPPKVADLQLETPRDTPLAITLQAEDREDDALSFRIVQAPEHGVLEGEAPDLVYVPDSGYLGEDFFTYVASDGEFDSREAQVLIRILGPDNSAPQAGPQSLSTTQETALEIALSGTDAEGDALSFEVLEGPAYGILAGEAPNLTYTPAPGFHGEDSFTFRAFDGELHSAPAMIAIQVTRTNQAPVAEAQSLSTLQDVPLTIVLTGSDPDGDALNFEVVDRPAYGSLLGEAPQLIYTPLTGFRGEDAFSFRVNDGSSSSNPASISIVVLSSELPNDPVTITSTPNNTVLEDEAYRYDVVATGGDPSQPLDYRLLQAPAAMQIGSATGRIEWQPVAPYVGSNLLPDRHCFLRHPAVDPASAIDLVVMVDESGSMDEEQSWVRDIAAPMQGHLLSQGIGLGEEPNRYGLIGFSNISRPIPVGEGPLGTYLDLMSAASELNILGSSQEDGFLPIMHALTHYPLREDAERSLILVTDEPRAAVDWYLTFDVALAELTAKRAKLHAVVAAGFLCADGSSALGMDHTGRGFVANGTGGYRICEGAVSHGTDPNTNSNYVNLALQSGGSAWALGVLRQGGHLAQSFTRALVDAQARGVVEQPSEQPLADLYIAAVASNGDGFDVEIGNRGLAALVEPAQAEMLLDGVSVALLAVPTLAAGDRHVLHFAWPGQDTGELAFGLQTNAPQCHTDNDVLNVPLVKVRVSDVGASFGEQTFAISVLDANEAPQVVSQPATTASVGVNYRYTVRATDPDAGDSLEFLLVAGPAGMRVDRLSGALQFVPDATQEGAHDVELQVRDLAGAVGSQAFQIEVGRAYAPPRFTSVPTMTFLRQGWSHSYVATVEGDPSAQLTLDVVLAPEGFSFDPVTGLAEFDAPEVDVASYYPVALRVRDDAGNYDLQVYIVTVDRANAAPVITSQPWQRALQASYYSYQAQVADVNLFETISWRLDFGPAGAAVAPNRGNVVWSGPQLTSPAPSPLAVSNPQCLVSDNNVAPPISLRPRLTIANTIHAGQPLIGPLLDSNRDGLLGSEDQIAAVFLTNYISSSWAPSVRAVDLRDGSALWSYRGHVPHTQVQPAMGDLTGEGEVTVLFVDAQRRLIALNGDGSLRWVSDQAFGPVNYLLRTSISLADIDADGSAEIIVGPSVFNSEGQRLWSFTSNWEQQGDALAIDLDGDGLMEVMYRNEVRSHLGALLFTTPALPDSTVRFSFFAPARLSGGERPDIVISERHGTESVLLAMTAQGDLLWRLRAPNVTHVGPLLTADFVAGGDDEIFLPSTGQMFDSSGAVLWDVGMTEGWRRHDFSGGSVADLNGDGELEILTFGNYTLQVVSAAHGAILAGDSEWYILGNEEIAPVLVDPYGHGQPMLVVGGRGLRAYESADGPWQGSMRAANQLDLASDRVLPNLQVPASLPGAWPRNIRLMADRAGTTPTTSFLSDLAVSAPYTQVEGGSGTGRVRLIADVVNRGTARSLPFELSFFAGSPQEPALIGAVAGPELLPGQKISLVLGDLAEAALGEDLVYAQLHLESNVSDCELGNQLSAGRAMQLSATDHGGLEGTQRWVVSVTGGSRAPSILSSPPLTATENLPYDYAVIAQSSLVGDSVRFKLIEGPVGASINPRTGELHWTPAWGQAGSHFFRINAISLSGVLTHQTWWMTVSPSTTPNTSPQILSLPPLLATPDLVYRYPLEAIDPDGDTLTYVLTQFPAGMTIDAQTGLVLWIPNSSQIGSAAVSLEARDPRGGVDVQTFEIDVQPEANEAPEIQSQPLLQALVGQSYFYAVSATDADGDTLNYVWPLLPSGAQFDSDTLTLQWTPVSGQAGVHPLRLEVSDGRGGVAVQEFNLRVFDPANNVGPNIDSTAPKLARVGRDYQYAVLASDPDGDSLIYSLTLAPTGMQVDAITGLITWTPHESGSAEVTLRVSDGLAWVEQAWTITILSADAELAVSLALDPATAVEGQTVGISVLPENNVAPLSVDLRLDDAPLPVDADLRASLLAGTPGSYALTVTISDGIESASAEATLVVHDPDAAVPTARLIEPAAHPTQHAVEITAPTPITGEITGDVGAWHLVRRERGGTAQQLLASGTGAFAAQQLAVFDPTLQVNGLHELILQATGLNGEVVSDSRVLRVTGDMKLGHFSIAFEEASIPLAGIPVTVTRSYDTRRAHESLDFGHGWSVDASSVRLQESRAPGLGWEVQTLGSGLSLRYCVLPYGSPIVTVTLPDGQVESFQAKASPECSALVPATSVQLGFEPLPGTHSRLEAPTLSEARVVNGNLVEISQPDQPIDPQRYRLTTAEGLVFDLDQGFGLQRLTDPASGQHLSFSRDGVLHSSGEGIAFVRDSLGRIVRMELPDETAITYAYTPAGDLESVTDQVENITRFEYVADPRWPHYLQDIIDPRNIRVARNEYDDDGRLVASIDADGHRIEFDHDVVGRVQRITDRRGHTSTYVFDDRGRVLSETNALHETTTRTYDDFGNELTRRDPLGRITTNTYDARGNPLTQTNSAGETTTSSYNARNQLLTQHDAAGRLVMRNTYDSATGTQLTETRDALNHVTGFVYDSGPGTGNTGGLARLTDAAGASTRFEYSVSTGFKIAEVDAQGQRSDYVNDRMGRVLRETRTRRLPDATVETLITTYTYDDKGRLTDTEYPDGSTTRTEFGPNDQPTRECDALDRCTVTRYDARGNVDRIEYADGTFEIRGYDANGNLTAQTDRMGRRTTMVYDAANRLTQTIHPDAETDDGDDSNNPRSTQRYNAASELIESEDELGRITQYRYDDAGRQTHVIAPHPETGAAGAGSVLETVYDQTGRREASIDPSGAITRYVYDAAGRLVETIHPDPVADDGDDSNNPRTRTDYDAVGRKTADTDEAGRITRYAFDALGRLVAVVLPNPVTGANPELIDGVSPDAGTLTTRYGYDEAGNKTQQIDAEGRVTRFEYDSLGRETARILPEGQRETKVYNDAGELESHTDFNGQTTVYRYGDAGQLERIEYPNDPLVRFEYNAAGERERAIDARGTSHSGFDERGRLVSKHDADGGLIEYEYDAAGNLLARISPSQSLVYEYDALNRLQRVTRSVDGEAPTMTSYEYDGNGRRSAMIGGDGIRTEYAYDRRNRLTGLLKRTAAGVMLLGMGYTVDASGMRTGIEEFDPAGEVRTVEYAYDPVKRLVSESIDHRDDANDRHSEWVYDRVGNRLTQIVSPLPLGEGGAPAPGEGSVTSYTYDNNDRLLTETTDDAVTQYTYDDNGNTLSKSGPDGSVSYAYNDANRLIRASNADGITAYVYDADGLRVRQTHAPTLGTPVTTWYVQDNNYAYAQVIEAYESVGAGLKRLTATYTFADDLVSQTRYDAAGNPSTSFVQMDGFGSTRWLTDSNGAITDEVDYDAFGNTVRREGSTEVEHLYRGERFDALLDAYDLRARLYLPGNGRFLNQDTFRGFSMDPRSLHKYAFNHNDPVNRTDPSGHMSLMDALETLKGIQISVGVRLTMWGWRHPWLSALGPAIAASILLPMEMQVPTPMSFAPMAWGATGQSIKESGKHLSSLMRLLERNGNFSGAGGNFEDFVGSLLRIEKNTRPYYIDLPWRLKAKFIPDFPWKGGFLEAKAVSELRIHDLDQATKLAAYAAQNGVPLTYLFLRRPSARDLERLREAIEDGTGGAEIVASFNWVFE